MTDNGSCCKAKAFRAACRDLGLKHVRTKPYTPRTNGKAERFIQTALREWAYARAYPTSHHWADELPKWIHDDNWHRPHGGIEYAMPISRLALNQNNLLRLHTKKVPSRTSLTLTVLSKIHLGNMAETRQAGRWHQTLPIDRHRSVKK